MVPILLLSVLPFLASIKRKAQSFTEKSIDYGVLTPVTNRLSKRSASPKLLATLDALSTETGLTPHEILLKWAWQLNMGGGKAILTTSTSNAERAKKLVQLLGEKEEQGCDDLDKSVYARLEEAAREDGYEGKTFYLHPHMNK